MIDISGYFSEAQPVAIGALIALKPTSITVIRNGDSLASQIVRLETLASQRQIQAADNRVYMVDALALGYKNHPTVADTDLRAGDRFNVGSVVGVGGVNYEVVIVMPAHLDCVQAYLQVRA